MVTAGGRRALHVVSITPTYFDDQSLIGGGERFPQNLAVAIGATRDDMELTLVSYAGQPGRRDLGAGSVLRLLESHRGSNGFNALSWSLPDVIEGADVVHVHQPFTRSSEVAILAATALGKPCCVTDYGAKTSQIGESLGILEFADVIVAYSQFGASLVSGSSRPVEVVPGGVDADFFCPPADPPRRTHMLYAGRLLPHKGIDRLIAALPPSVPLIVCGRVYHDEYFALLSRLSAGKSVTFVTDADDQALRALYRSAWATILPSVHVDCYGTAYEQPELMGLTALESMACATPAVVSDVAALPEFVADGHTGFVFSSLEQLSERLEQLASDPVLTGTMGQQARLRVEEEFSMERASQHFAAIYAMVAGGAYRSRQ